MVQYTCAKLPLEDTVAVVTGGSGSIGQVIVEALALAGSRVTVLDAIAPEATAPSSATYADRVHHRCVNVADPAEVETVMRSIIKHFQKIDILVHCAGVLGPIGPLESASWPALEEAIAVNLHGAVLCSRGVLPYMKQQGHGCIVFIASIAALIGSAPAPVYAAAKAGLVGLARGLAGQVGRHRIRVNCVSPGSVAGTKLMVKARGHPPTAVEVAGLLAQLPLAETVRAQDVADAVLFLCGEQSHAITGANLIVDAGETLRFE